MRRMLVLFALVAGFGGVTRAELLVSFDPSASSHVQGTDFNIDVMVTSTTALDVYGFTLVFGIERVSPTGDLTFVDPQDLSHRTAADNFVLGDDVVNDSSNVMAGGTEWQTIFSTPLIGDPLLPVPVTLPADEARLLARLQLTSPSLPLLTSDVLFRIRLLDGSYLDDEGEPPLVTSSEVMVTITPGSSPPPAVPEPSTLLAGLIGLATLGLWHARRRVVPIA